MNYLRVHNWDRWQNYRNDRGQPPWIKVHRCLMRRPEWVGLSDAERGQLVAIWLLAADRNGELPDDAELVKKLCFMATKPDLNGLVEHGWLERDANVASTRRQGDANVTPSRRQHDAPEKRRGETETEAETEEMESACARKAGSRFTPPTVDQVAAYCAERGNSVNPQRFIDHYAARGWMAGKSKVKDWKACVRTWEQQDAKPAWKANLAANEYGDGQAQPLPVIRISEGQS